MLLPRLYPIVDVESLERRGLELGQFTRELVAGGAEIVQLRDKRSAPQQVLRHAEMVSAVIAGGRCMAVMNDRADLAFLAGWYAVHVGHLDMPPDAVRRVFGSHPGESVIVGVSTHTDTQVTEADANSADYIAVGPVFATGTKRDAEAVIGLEGVRSARKLTNKRLVAIGGITRANAASVIAAGADSVAVIGALVTQDQTTEQVVRDFLQRLR